MRFLVLPDLVTGVKGLPADRLRQVAERAVPAEELGFDGFDRAVDRLVKGEAR